MNKYTPNNCPKHIWGVNLSNTSLYGTVSCLNCGKINKCEYHIECSKGRACALGIEICSNPNHNIEELKKRCTCQEIFDFNLQVEKPPLEFKENKAEKEIQKKLSKLKKDNKILKRALHNLAVSVFNMDAIWDDNWKSLIVRLKKEAKAEIKER